MLRKIMLTILSQIFFSPTNPILLPIELTTAILPRFYQINFDSGVQSINMTIEGAKDIENNSGSTVKCASASFYYHFRNGCLVVARGQLRVTFSPMLKIDMWEFQTTTH